MSKLREDMIAKLPTSNAVTNYFFSTINTSHQATTTSQSNPKQIKNPIVTRGTRQRQQHTEPALL
jgi:hypothetical protein